MFLRLTKFIKESSQVLSLILEKPSGFHFYAGQYLNIELGDNDKDFTISSSPSEDHLMITTRISNSQFKKNLTILKPGDTITTSHPAGTFTLDETEPAIFIAGGIGITPFRSMIKYAIDQNLKTPITLIYSNSDENFLFKEELDEWKSHLPNLNIIYHNTSQNGHLSHLLSTIYHLPIYYLAGSPSFVDEMAKILKDSGVDEINIRYDRFDGYD